MLRAFSTSATGMIAQQNVVDVIANNLANVNTVGFKRSQVDFQDLMYVKLGEAGATTTGEATAPSGFEIGSGVQPGSTVKVFSAGEMDPTKRSLDVAVRGTGFFQVQLPDGTTRYTRDGSFQLGTTGKLVTSKGYEVLSGVTIPANSTNISISADGTVTTVANGVHSSAGIIQLARFANPAGLSSLGDNLLGETVASGTAEVGTAGEDGFGTLQQRVLERSNVQMVNELVNLIKAQRAYEINARAIKAGDEMLTTANRIVG